MKPYEPGYTITKCTATPLVIARSQIKLFRSNHKLSDGHTSLKVGILFQDLRVGQHKVLGHRRLLWGHWLYIAALRLEDGDLLVVATQSALQLAIQDYAQRWGIETLFGVFKTRGLCLESTHLSDPQRLSNNNRHDRLVEYWKKAIAPVDTLQK